MALSLSGLTGFFKIWDLNFGELLT